MSAEIASEEIDGQVWEVSPYSATKGIKILAKLTKTIGPAFGSALGGAGSVEGMLNSGTGSDAIGKALDVLSRSLDEDGTVALVKDILAGVSVDGKPLMPIFDTVFQGRYSTLFKVVVFVLKTNYADFFGSLTSASATAGK